jgi:hypothetical protein
VKALLAVACACSIVFGSAATAGARTAHECRPNRSATPRRELPAALKFVNGRLVGDGDLWTIRPGQPAYTVGDNGWTRLKHPWFRLADGQLTIAGRRVDGGSGTFRADIPPMEAYPRDLNLAIGPGFIPSSLEFSAGGCWKVIARFRESKVVLYLDVTRAEPGHSPG